MTRRVVSFVLDDQRDRDLLDWLDEQPNKSGSLRDAVRAYRPPAGGAGPAPATGQAAIAALRDELARLPDVVAEAVRETLAAYRLAPTPPSREPSAEDPELAARLDNQLTAFFGE